MKQNPKKKNSFFERLREWDEGNFDLTEAAMGELHPPRPERKHQNMDWVHHHLVRMEAREVSFFEHLYPFMAVILAAAMILFLLVVVSEMPAFGRADTPANTSVVIKRYIGNGLEETGAVNIVAGVILDYRAFDTLGESHVLFTAAIAVFILLLQEHDEKEKQQDLRILKNDLILRKTAAVLLPLIIMFGVYVILCGHLGPGGGFSGGAIIGGGLILYSMAFNTGNLGRVINMRSYRIIVLCALLSYSILKCYSFFCGANGLHTIFTTGTPGAIFSAGLILPLNTAVGLVVACTMYGFYSIFTKGRI